MSDRVTCPRCKDWMCNDGSPRRVTLSDRSCALCRGARKVSRELASAFLLYSESTVLSAKQCISLREQLEGDRLHCPYCYGIYGHGSGDGMMRFRLEDGDSVCNPCPLCRQELYVAPAVHAAYTLYSSGCSTPGRPSFVEIERLRKAFD